MRKLIVLLVLVGGCKLPASSNGGTLHLTGQAPTPQAIRTASRIVVNRGTWGIHSGSTSWHCVFEDSGNCFCEIISSDNGGWHSSPQLVSKKTVELPAESFRQIQKALLDSKFLSLKQGEQGFVFEGGGSCSVECQGRTHAVSFGTLPPEYQSIMECLQGLLQRGKESSSGPVR
jgi:hypothetical protein